MLREHHFCDRGNERADGVGGSPEDHEDAGAASVPKEVRCPRNPRDAVLNDERFGFAETTPGARGEHHTDRRIGGRLHRYS